jgi:hypothetical protein
MGYVCRRQARQRARWIPGLLFTRLAGGRAPRSEGVELGGDKHVAARIVEQLNYVI